MIINKVSFTLLLNCKSQAVEKPKSLPESFKELKISKMTETAFSNEVKQPFIYKTIVVSLFRSILLAFLFCDLKFLTILATLPNKYAVFY